MKKVPFVESVDSKLTIRGGYSWGERCCKDCSKGNEPAEWDRIRGTVVLDVDAKIGKSFGGKQLLDIAFKGYGIKGSADVSFGVRVGFSTRPQVNVFADRLKGQCEEGGCASATLGVDVSVTGKITGIDADISAYVVLDGERKELFDVKAEAEIKLRLAKSGAFYAFNVVDAGTCPSPGGNWFVGAGTAEAGAKLVISVFGAGIYNGKVNYIIEMWGAQFGTDFNDQ